MSDPFKLPEPALEIGSRLGGLACGYSTELRRGELLYTADQLRAAWRAGVEAAAGVAEAAKLRVHHYNDWDAGFNDGVTTAVRAIRALEPGETA